MSADARHEIGAEIVSQPYLLDADAAQAYNRGLDTPPRRRPPKNIHSDPAAAARAGFSAPIAAGEQTFAVIAQFLVAQFDMHFLRGGRIEILLTRPVLYGDSLISHAVIEREEEDSLKLKVWVENQHGARVLEGTASVRRTE
jgi:acyl dehydratase